MLTFRKLIYLPDKRFSFEGLSTHPFLLLTSISSRVVTYLVFNINVTQGPIRIYIHQDYIRIL